MKICFVLPKFTRQPIGGYKIIFEYANRLVENGEKVNILFINDGALQRFKIPDFLKKIIISFVTQIEPRWFNLDKRIKKVSNLDRNYLKEMEDLDVCFATGVQTVDEVKFKINSKKKLYFIQGYENWQVDKTYLHETYHYFTNIVVSTWLKKKVEPFSQGNVYLIKNPIDIKQYKCYIPQDGRKCHTIGLLYHKEKIKGLKYSLEAVKKVHDVYPDTLVYMFGMFPKPKDLPEWIHYTRGASQSETIEIYNRVQVFLCGSIEEGYGLTGLEAMACGACLVSTNYSGVREYAINGYNSLLSPIKDSKALADNILFLFENKSERSRISNNGIKTVKEFSWESALEKLNKLLY